MSRYRIAVIVLFVACMTQTAPAQPPELRWVYLQQNLQVKENLPKIEAILRRAKAAGYNGVVLADYKLNILDRVPEHYFANAAEFKRICAELELENIPTVCGFGYSSGILAHDPNLAEGLPVRDQPLVVRGGKGEVEKRVNGADGRVLSHSNLGAKRDQDWTQHHAVFNSLESNEVRFYVGAWDCGSGRLWQDDVEVVEEPFVNLVRRPGCPLKVTDESGKIVYEEGRDFAALKDDKLGVTPWQGEFDIHHEPPALKILPGGRIKEGQKLLVSFYHAVTIYDGQMPCSLTEPRVFEIVEDQVGRVNELFQPKTFFLSHDEIRVAGWSEPEMASGKSAGELLAENVRRCVSIIKKHNPGARLCIWSDMFDPHHNAKNQFYLVRGDLAGSWEGLPQEMLLINWNSGNAAKSLPFFAEHSVAGGGLRSHGQVLAGYYDAPPERIKTWLVTGDATKSAASIRGVMYTTWQGNFADLEKFAAAAW